MKNKVRAPPAAKKAATRKLPGQSLTLKTLSAGPSPSVSAPLREPENQPSSLRVKSSARPRSPQAPFCSRRQPRPTHPEGPAHPGPWHAPDDCKHGYTLFVPLSATLKTIKHIPYSMAQSMRFYHNPSCSKSRQAKKILDEQGAEYETVLYLKDPPSLSELKKIAKALDEEPQVMLRAKEAREAGWGPKPDHSTTDLLTFIAENPKVLQRPILLKGDRAVVGRPPERVQELI